MNKFNFLVSEATSPASDLEHCVRGMMLYAEANATGEEIEDFLQWLDDKTMRSAINTATTSPADHFACCEGKTWRDMEKAYKTQ